MCEKDRREQSGETRDEKNRSEPPPAEETSEQVASSVEPNNLARSWGERIGYGF